MMKYKLKNRAQVRAQVTIFMIIGLVIVVLFGLVILSAVQTSEARIKKESERILTSFVETSSINSYVQTCLDIVSNDVLKKLGEQSVLYESQGGAFPQEKVVEINMGTVGNPRMVNVSFGLEKEGGIYNYRYNDGERLPPPYYPIPETKIADLDNIIKTEYRALDLLTDGHYGGVTLPSLCDIEGVNSPNVQSSAYRFGSCLPATYNSEIYVNNMTNKSFQEQLQDSIQGELRNCINISYLVDEFGYNISDGPAKIEFGFQTDTVRINADYPLTIKLRGGEPITRILTYSKEKPLRLKKMYNLLFFVLKKDSRELDFERDKELHDCPSRFGVDQCWDVNMNIQRTILPDKNYLIRITDEKSILEGKPYFIQTIVENRDPILEFIESPIYELENETIIITLGKADPDLEATHYEFKGWKETKTSSFNEECAKENQDANFEYIAENCVTYNSNSVRFWSKNFNHESETTTLNLVRDDVGIHNLTVGVRDVAGNIDWQDIIIWVYDLPIPKPTGSNYFSDINDSLASVEDPYLISGLESLSFARNITSYKWNISFEDGSVIWNFEMNNVEKVIPEEYTMKNIFSKIFNKTGNYTIGLKTQVLESHWSEEKFMNLTVHKCLPHNNSKTVPWPYHNNSQSLQKFSNLGLETTDNFFQADHTCCNENYEFENTNKNCFEYTVFGSIKQIQNEMERLNNFPETTIEIPSWINNYAVGNDKINDLIQLDFKRTCSGDRGNTCTGQITLTVKTEVSCPDYDNGETERCQGINIGELRTTNNFNCIKYSVGESFEKSWGLEDKNNNDADGICNENWKRSTPVTIPSNKGYGDNDGNYSCQAQCFLGNCIFPANCKCEYGNSYCDDLTWVGDFNKRSTKTVIIETCANSPFQQVCNANCGVQPKDNICRSNYNNLGLSYCTANVNCDGKTPYMNITSTSYCNEQCKIAYCDYGKVYDVNLKTCVPET